MTSQETPPLDYVLERVDRVEKRCRLLTWSLFAAVVVAVAITVLRAGASASAEREVVEAKKLVVKDTDGNIRAQIGVSAGNKTILFLHDANENIRVQLGVTDRESSMVLIDPLGRPRGMFARGEQRRTESSDDVPRE